MEVVEPSARIITSGIGCNVVLSMIVMICVNDPNGKSTREIKKIYFFSHLIFLNEFLKMFFGDKNYAAVICKSGKTFAPGRNQDNKPILGGGPLTFRSAEESEN